MLELFTDRFLNDRIGLHIDLIMQRLVASFYLGSSPITYGCSGFIQDKNGGVTKESSSQADQLSLSNGEVITAYRWIMQKVTCVKMRTKMLDWRWNVFFYLPRQPHSIFLPSWKHGHSNVHVAELAKFQHHRKYQRDPSCCAQCQRRVRVLEGWWSIEIYRIGLTRQPLLFGILLRGFTLDQRDVGSRYQYHRWWCFLGRLRWSGKETMSDWSYQILFVHKHRSFPGEQSWRRHYG